MSEFKLTVTRAFVKGPRNLCGTSLQQVNTRTGRISWWRFITDDGTCYRYDWDSEEWQQGDWYMEPAELFGEPEETPKLGCFEV